MHLIKYLKYANQNKFQNFGNVKNTFHYFKENEIFYPDICDNIFIIYQQ